MSAENLFRGGYVLRPAGKESLTGDSQLRRQIAEAWRSHRVGSFVISYDDTWELASVEHPAGIEVVLLGMVLDVESPGRGAEEILGGLAESLARSRDEFYERLLPLGGSHIIIGADRGRHFALQDATGVEALAYDTAGPEPLIASHPTLIAELRGYELSQLAREWLAHPKIGAGGYYFPGLKTTFDEVYALTPNTELDLDTGAISRFFPRAEIELRGVAEIADRSAEMLRNQFLWLRGREQVWASISGGLDSRLTLAASREAKDRIKYFTYSIWGNAVHENDRVVAANLAERFALDHRQLILRRDDEIPAGFAQGWERTHRGAQGGPSLHGALSEFFPPRALHVRSNVLEVVRGFYLKNRLNHPDTFDPYKLSRLFRGATAERFTPYFEEFCTRTGFDERSKLNYHYTDLFYWEHRLGAWHGPLVRGMKCAHTTFVPYNCRSLLALMLGRPLGDRLEATTVYATIERLWPEVFDVRIFSGARTVRRPPPLAEQATVPGSLPSPAERPAPNAERVLARTCEDLETELKHEQRLRQRAESAAGERLAELRAAQAAPKGRGLSPRERLRSAAGRARRGFRRIRWRARGLVSPRAGKRRRGGGA